jgi:hypothetical protein
MKLLAISCLMVFALSAKTQPPDSLIIFSGYVLDEDSLPVENALLVNFRTVRSCATNAKGFFKIWLLKGDSLMINHISYEHKIVKANNKPPQLNRFIIKFSPYEINSVDVDNRDIEMENFEKTLKSTNYQMKIKTPTYLTNTERNVYAPPAAGNQTVGINLFELIRYIKTKKYRKRVEENSR